MPSFPVPLSTFKTYRNISNCDKKIASIDWWFLTVLSKLINSVSCHAGQALISIVVTYFTEVQLTCKISSIERKRYVDEWVENCDSIYVNWRWVKPRSCTSPTLKLEFRFALNALVESSPTTELHTIRNFFLITSFCQCIQLVTFFTSWTRRRSKVASVTIR